MRPNPTVWWCILVCLLAPTVWWCILVCLLACCLATGVLAATYTWSGDGGTNAWDLPANWSGFCQTPCYPSSVDDDAIFPTSGPWGDCDLITEEIDDLTIEDDVDFKGDDNPVLTVDSLTINGATVATITDGAEIKTK